MPPVKREAPSEPAPAAVTLENVETQEETSNLPQLTLKAMTSTEEAIKSGELSKSSYRDLTDSNPLLSYSETESEVTTESTMKNLKDQLGTLSKDLAEEMGIPTWGLVAILIGMDKFHIH